MELESSKGLSFPTGMMRLEMRFPRSLLVLNFYLGWKWVQLLASPKSFPFPLQ